MGKHTYTVEANHLITLDFPAPGIVALIATEFSCNPSYWYTREIEWFNPAFYGACSGFYTDILADDLSDFDPDTYGYHAVNNIIGDLLSPVGW